MAGESYLVRDSTGRMYTVIAHSVVGAAKLFMQKHRPQVGSAIAVKLRGVRNDWAHYRVT